MRSELPDSISGERREVLENILNNVIEENNGTRTEAVVGETPGRKFFVGTLSPRKSQEDMADMKNSLKNKLNPPSIGLEFALEEVEDELEIEIDVSGRFFYRVFPEYEEQLESVRQRNEEGDEVRFLEKFVPVDLELDSIKIPLGKLISGEGEGAQKEVKLDQCKDLWEEAQSDGRFFSKNAEGQRKYPRLPREKLESEEEYEQYISSLNDAKRCPWGLRLSVESYPTEEGYRVLIELSNAQQERNDPTVEQTLFGANFDVEISNNEFSGFELDYLEENYRQDRNVEVSGINCSARTLSERRATTVSSPLFFEMKRESVDTDFELKFKDLSENPADHLSKLKSFLRTRLDDFEEEFKDELETEREQESFEEDFQMSKEEVNRFENGLELIENNERARSAFKLLNRAFYYASERNPEKGYYSWRPFQTTFIVSLIPDIVHSETPQPENYRDHVDLLYFPTGGGKTEAFLGTAVFQAFFDRLRGKEFGVSVLTKFPLRMLSLQQLQRIANIFAQAEEVRREEGLCDKEESEFSVGYFVGSSSTPNKLIDYDKERESHYDALDELEENRDKLRESQIITTCPFCFEESVDLEIDHDQRRIKHVCQEDKCGRTLPVYITDSEIYRYLPTFIVGTLDKLAISAMQINFRNMLGAVKYKCPEHGFTSVPRCVESTRGSDDRFCERSPDEMQEINQGDYGPSLIIQDEMHLVRDTLGTFDSHYETLFEALIEKYSPNDKCLKTIAATATISPETYQDHVKQLYLKDTVLFPANLELFTEEKDEVSRIVAGIMPHGKTHIHSMERVVESVNAAIQELQEEDISEEVLDDFRTILSYHNKRDDAHHLGRSVKTRINDNLDERGLKGMNDEPLTGENNFEEIRRLMEAIKNPSTSEEVIDILMATSIISHGVDIPSLNTMTFMGMPPNNAEYIQALSRIGRKKTGIAFIVFNPTRERDHSYYKYFKKFHELSDLLVETNPIKRWSKNAIENTVSGAVSTALVNYFDFVKDTSDLRGDLIFGDNVESAFNDRIVREDEVEDFVADVYDAEESGRSDELEEFVRSQAARQIENIQDNEHEERFTWDRMEPEPLMSFRDVESGATISLEEATHKVLKKGKISRDTGDFQ